MSPEYNKNSTSLEEANSKIILLTLELDALTDKLNIKEKLLLASNKETEELNQQLVNILRELKQSEIELRAVFDALLTGIVRLDAETHVIMDVNPPAARMIGAPKEEIIGHVCHKYICPTEVGKCPITDLGQSVDSAERTLLRNDGVAVPVIKSAKMTILGAKKCIIESFIDITERKKMDEALEKAHAELEGKVEERTKELREKLEELERFRKATVEREFRMKELSDEMKEGAKNFFKPGAADTIARELLSIVLSHEKLE